MVVLVLALLAGPAATSAAREVLPSEVGEALIQALVVPGGRIVTHGWSETGTCRSRQARHGDQGKTSRGLQISVPRPIDGSGRVAVKVSGPNCTGWGWAEVTVWAPTAVTTRAVRAGEPVSSAVRVTEQEVRSGRPPFLPAANAVAARFLPSGAALGELDVAEHAGAAGDPVKIVFLSGSVAIEASGRRTTCVRSRACAVLPSGRHVEGYFGDGGQLIVEVPR
jgi:hypothetical protein